MSYIGSNIRYLRKEKNYSQSTLGKMLGKSESTIQMWESGYRFPTMATVTKIATIFELSVDDLVNKDLRIKVQTSKVSFINIPVYGALCCGNGGFNDDNIEEYVPIPSRMLKKGKEYFGNYAKGESMKDENINSGDLIIFEKVQVLENGQIGCFCVNDEKAMCKRYKKDDRTNIIMLLPANPNFDPIVVTLENTNFRIIGKLALVVNDRQDD